jgi:mono/diheme cytochrome c family protein
MFKRKHLVAVVVVFLFLALASWPGFSADNAPAGGAELFAKYCAACHGTDGKGHGPAAARLPTPPQDMTTAKFWQRADVEKKIAEAIASGSNSMPPLRQVDEAAAQKIVEYMTDSFRPQGK